MSIGDICPGQHCTIKKNNAHNRVEKSILTEHHSYNARNLSVCGSHIWRTIHLIGALPSVH